jgi:hypothetical protein
MYKIVFLCFALLFVGCGSPSCDSKESKKLVMESVEKTVKMRLARRLNPSVIGDEWRSAKKETAAGSLVYSSPCVFHLVHTPL